eukprot:scaffold26287_cov214-Amphora_coffeaeformis.AAC.3
MLVARRRNSDCQPASPRGEMFSRHYQDRTYVVVIAWHTYNSNNPLVFVFVPLLDCQHSSNMSSNESSSSKKEVRIAVGSRNPAKLRAVEQALRKIFAAKQQDSITIVMSGYDVESGVRDQPIGDKETCLGAKNRALAAYQAYRKEFDGPPHLAFGLEGGLEMIALPNGTSLESDDNHPMYCMAWMAVYGKRSAFTVDLIASQDVKTYHGDRTPRFGFGKTGTFPIPPKVTELVRKGIELGHANDQVFNSRESKSGLGAVGLLTGGLIDRSAYYEHAIMLAMTPWFRPDVYV